MKSIRNFCSGVFLTLLIATGTTTAHAQQSPDPIEIIACNYINGSDGGDLQSPMNDINEWLDEQQINNFNISTLIPIYTSNAFTYDVLFLNRWTDGSAMGQSLEAFYGPDGADAGEGFNDVVDCSSTTSFAGILLQPPGPSRNGGPMQFFNCTVKENRTVGEGIGAINAWAQASREAGLENGTGHAVLLPIAGENPDATYSFKWLVLFESFQAYGDSLDDLFAPGGPSLGDIIDPVMDCDSARFYSQVINRQAQE
jgi:hypothetical protein